MDVGTELNNLFKDMNNGPDSRLNGISSNPMENQARLLKIFPQLCLSPWLITNKEFFPGQVDEENIPYLKDMIEKSYENMQKKNKSHTK